MNLISCEDGCGVVYNADAIPKVELAEDGSYPQSKFCYDNGEFLPIFKCAVCGADVSLPKTHWM